MCSAANCVLPLRKNCEGLTNPGRLHGGASMSINATGFRPHRPLQDSEMDLTWQELMAITDLQEFEVPNENPFEAIPYLSMEPMVSLGGFGMTQPQTESLPVCDENHVAAYEGSYSEVMPACQRLNPNAEAHYGHSGAQLASRLLPHAQSLQPPLMSLLEHINLASGSQGLGKDIMGHPHGPGLGPRPTKQQPAMDDRESDSGLSLGSSPPLASPENAIPGAAAYLGTEAAALGYAEGEMDMGEQCRMRANLVYSMDYQHPLNPYQGSHSSYFPVPPILPSMQQQAQQAAPSLKQHQILPTALHDLHLNGSGMAGTRGSPCPAPYMKPRGGCAQAPMSRDERRAHSLKIPFALEKIVNLPVDDFNELLTQYTLSDAQMALVRDIRRRGKNKVAAQNCRKRKLDNIVHLEGELGQLQAQREHMARERLEFQRNLAIIKCRLSDLYAKVFSQLRDEDGHPYSLDDYSLQQTNDGNIFLVPRNAALEGE